MIQRLWRSWRERLRRMVDGVLPNDEGVLTPDSALSDGESVHPSSAGAFEQANAPAKTPQPDAGLARQIKSRLRLGVLQRVSQALPVRVTRPDPITCYRAPTVMQNVPTGPLPMVKPPLVAGASAEAAQEDQTAQERAAADAAWEALWALRGTRSTAGQPVPAVPLSSTRQVDDETGEGAVVGSSAAAPQSTAPQSTAPQAVKLQPATSKKGPLPRVKAISRPVSAGSEPFSEQVKGVLPAAPGHPGPQSAALQDGMLQPGVSQQPDAPQPSAPQPSALQPSALQPSAPQPSALQPSAPQPSAPQPSAPQPSAPQPSAPQFIAPQTGAPQQSTAPQSAPQTGAPQPSAPQSAPQFIAPQSAPQSDTTRAAVTRRPLARRVADKPVRPQVRRKLAPTSFPSAPVGVRPQQLPSTGRSLRQATQRETATQAISWPEAAPETPPETPPKIPSTASGAASTADVTSRPGPLLAALRAGLEKLGISRREATQPQAARHKAAPSRQHPSEPALARWAGLPRSAAPGRMSLPEPVRPSETLSLSKSDAVVDEKLPVSSPGERPVARRMATGVRLPVPTTPVEPPLGAGPAEARPSLTGPVTGPVTGPPSAAEISAGTSTGRGEDSAGQPGRSSAAATPTFFRPAMPTTTTVWRTVSSQPDLASLMRPTLVPVPIQREVGATAQPAAAESQPASPSPAGPSPAEDRAGDRTRTQALDLESLSHQVYQIIRRRLAVERERERGR